MHPPPRGSGAAFLTMPRRCAAPAAVLPWPGILRRRGTPVATAKFQVEIERDVPVRMRDGVTLFADVYRPRGDGPFPVLLQRLPYDKDSAQANLYAHPSYYARQGYVVAAQ